MGVIGVAVYSAVQSEQKATNAAVRRAGTQAPAFNVPGLHGGRVRSADARGRPMVINFWASWCVPCRAEFPALATLRKDVPRKDLDIVGMTYKDLPDDARRFAKEHDATWRLGYGGVQGGVGKAYGVRSLPQTFFVDRNGKIVARFFGELSEEQFKSEAKKIMASKAS